MDALDAVLCAEGILDWTPLRGALRRLRGPQLADQARQAMTVRLVVCPTHIDDPPPRPLADRRPQSADPALDVAGQDYHVGVDIDWRLATALEVQVAEHMHAHISSLANRAPGTAPATCSGHRIARERAVRPRPCRDLVPRWAAAIPVVSEVSRSSKLGTGDAAVKCIHSRSSDTVVAGA
jgi:hypothetical protein